jgi:long-subunit fatty acid transport protein
MGSAFLGRADDASAAEANPAGLTIISKRELTLEFRNQSLRANLPGLVTEADGTLPARFQQGPEYESTKSYPSFAAFAMPIGNFAISAYYHQPLNFSPGEQKTGAQILEVNPGSEIRRTVFFPGKFTASYKSTTIGLAGAARIGQFSIGAAARRQSLEVNSTGTRFGVLDDNNTLRSDVTLEGSTSATSYSAGLLWASKTEDVTFGAVYKKGSDFTDIDKQLRQRYASPTAAATTPTLRETVFRNSSGAVAPVSSTFQIPDRYGIGMSLRWPNGFTLNEDIVRVKYSQLLKGFTSGVFCDTFAIAGYGGANDTPNAFCSAEAAQFGFVIEDVTEVHLGAEWVIPQSPVAVRLGAWVDPAHRPFFDAKLSTNSTFLTQNANNLQCRLSSCENVQAVLGNARANATTNLSGLGGREIHYSAGVGFLARNFELHAGFDRSTRTQTFSFQALTRF